MPATAKSVKRTSPEAKEETPADTLNTVNRNDLRYQLPAVMVRVRVHREHVAVTNNTQREGVLVSYEEYNRLIALASRQQ